MGPGLRGMTKKDFEYFAAMTQCELMSRVHEVGPEADAGRDAVLSMARRMADKFELDNPRFNRQRFLTACVKGTNISPE
jgi:hypothetical protein